MRKESECEEYNRRSSRIPLAISPIQVADVAGNTARADLPGVWSALALHLQRHAARLSEGLRHLVTEKQQIREKPKAQRFAGRPTLEKLLGQRSSGKSRRDQLIARAI
jgi:hypothetical protein